MKNHEIESAFNYKGFNCIVVKLGLDCTKQWRCGYVELKEENKGLTEDDAECLIDCHGGITFYGTREFYGLGLSVGFDCNHLGDSLKTCSLEYCINQCKKIADQLDILAKGCEEDKSKKPDRCQFCQSEDEFNDNIITSAAKCGSHVIVGAEAFIENGCLSLYLSNANDDFIAMDTVIIKYCPMCGRRL